VGTFLNLHQILCISHELAVPLPVSAKHGLLQAVATSTNLKWSLNGMELTWHCRRWQMRRRRWGRMRC